MSRQSPRGATVWFTGLPAAGKTTLSLLVGRELERRSILVDYLDGDFVRQHVLKELSFSRDDREANIEQIAWVASRLSRAGVVVLVAVIAPFEATRRRARAVVEEFAPFIEVHVATSVAECARRDPKGLYARAYAGEIQHFTGVSDPYEPPQAPDLRVKTEGEPPELSAQRVVAFLERRALVRAVASESVLE